MHIPDPSSLICDCFRLADHGILCQVHAWHTETWQQHHVHRTCVPPLKMIPDGGSPPGVIILGSFSLLKFLIKMVQKWFQGGDLFWSKGAYTFNYQGCDVVFNDETLHMFYHSFTGSRLFDHPSVLVCLLFRYLYFFNFIQVWDLVWAGHNNFVRSYWLNHDWIDHSHYSLLLIKSWIIKRDYDWERFCHFLSLPLEFV